MNIRKFALTSLLAIAATGIAAGTANAAPTVPTTPAVSPMPGAISMHGIDHGIGYTTTLSKDFMGITTSVDQGKFTSTPDGSTITVTGIKGEAIGSFPMNVTFAGQQVHLRPTISHNGKTLTLEPEGASHPNHDVSVYNNNLKHVAQARHLKNIGLLGAIVGGAAGIAVMGTIGAAIGTALGAVFLFVGSIPGFFIGAVAGGLIGAIGGGFMGAIFL